MAVSIPEQAVPSSETTSIQAPIATETPTAIPAQEASIESPAIIPSTSTEDGAVKPTSAPQTTPALAPASTSIEKDRTTTNQEHGAVQSVQPPQPTMVDTTIKSHHGAEALSPVEVHDLHSADFTGDINTNNEIPSQETLDKIANINVLDRDGRSIPFKNIYTGPNVARRVLVIFIRHFFCGVCLSSAPNSHY